MDRARLVQEIKKLLPTEFSFATDQSSQHGDIGILICGCLTACADKLDFKNRAHKWIIIAGHSVDHSAMPEAELAGIVISKIKAFQ